MDYEGEFDGPNVCKGHYKSNKHDEFDAAGTFELKISH